MSNARPHLEEEQREEEQEEGEIDLPQDSVGGAWTEEK